MKYIKHILINIGLLLKKHLIKILIIPIKWFAILLLFISRILEYIGIRLSWFINNLSD